MLSILKACCFKKSQNEQFIDDESEVTYYQGNIFPTINSIFQLTKNNERINNYNSLKHDFLKKKKIMENKLSLLECHCDKKTSAMTLDSSMYCSKNMELSVLIETDKRKSAMKNSNFDHLFIKDSNLKEILKSQRKDSTFDSQIEGNFLSSIHNSPAKRFKNNLEDEISDLNNNNFKINDNKVPKITIYNNTSNLNFPYIREKIKFQENQENLLSKNNDLEINEVAKDKDDEINKYSDIEEEYDVNDNSIPLVNFVKASYSKIKENLSWIIFDNVDTNISENNSEKSSSNIINTNKNNNFPYMYSKNNTSNKKNIYINENKSVNNGKVSDLSKDDISIRSFNSDLEKNFNNKFQTNNKNIEQNKSPISISNKIPTIHHKTLSVPQNSVPVYRENKSSSNFNLNDNDDSKTIKNDNNSLKQKEKLHDTLNNKDSSLDNKQIFYFTNEESSLIKSKIYTYFKDQKLKNVEILKKILSNVCFYYVFF